MAEARPCHPPAACPQRGPCTVSFGRIPVMMQKCDPPLTPRARPPAGRSESPRTGVALGGDRALPWSALGARPWPSEAWLWRAGGVRPGLPPGPQGLCPIDAKTDFLPEKRKGEYCLTLDANTRTLVALSVGVRGRYPAPAMLAPPVASQGPPGLGACTGHPPSSASPQPAPGTCDRSSGRRHDHQCQKPQTRGRRRAFTSREPADGKQPGGRGRPGAGATAAASCEAGRGSPAFWVLVRIGLLSHGSRRTWDAASGKCRFSP